MSNCIHGREWKSRQRRRRRQNPARRFPPPAAAAHGHRCRLRHQSVRRLRGAREREVGQELQPSRPGMRWCGGDDDRRPGFERQPASAAAGVLRESRAAMRILHPRHDHVVAGSPAAQQQPERSGGSGVAGGQPLPLHGISQHLVAGRIPALAALADGIGDPQVRNRGTIGGSIANNIHASAEYRAHLVLVMACRAVSAAAGQGC